jgi:hypothetical protein
MSAAATSAAAVDQVEAMWTAASERWEQYEAKLGEEIVTPLKEFEGFCKKT